MRTSPFVILAVTIASDGSIWTVGYEKGEKGFATSDFNVVRRFDRTGKVLDSFVRHSELKMEPGRDLGMDQSPLVSSRDGRVGWLFEAGRLYVEFSTGGKILRSISMSELYAQDPAREQKRVHGVGLCDGGGLFVSANWKEAGRVTKWGVFRYDGDTGAWKFIRGTRNGACSTDVTARSSPDGPRRPRLSAREAILKLYAASEKPVTVELRPTQSLREGLRSSFESPDRASLDRKCRVMWRYCKSIALFAETLSGMNFKYRSSA